MINILYILIEQGVFELDRPFYYYYESDKEIKVGTRVLVNFNNKNLVGFVVANKFVNDPLERVIVDYKKIKPIISLIDEEPIIDKELFELADFLSKRYVCPLISCLQAILPKSLKPSSSSKNVAKPQYFQYLRYLKSDEILTKKQKEVLKFIEEKQPLKSEVSPSILNKLIEKNLVEIYKVEKFDNLKYSNEKFEDFTLTPLQQKVYEGILNTNKTTSLLYGVTGSGKTEIYIKLIEETLKSGRTAVFLVPEINLTPYFCDKLNHYFERKISILTSGLSDSVRYMEYRKILKGDSKVVIGTRSAIFAPLKNIGLIIIDEEFNENYKQSDENPQYHAIEVAKYRCQKNDAKLVLGSATPSVESMARAMNGQYELFILKERYNSKELPKAKLINMSNRDNLYPGYSFLSTELVMAMRFAIAKNEKILLLLNKKGNSSFSICDDCNSTLICKKCGRPLSFNKNSNTYRCYSCGISYKKGEISCDCGSKDFTEFGIGTEKLEESLNKLFPNEKILRLDSDVASKSTQIARVLNDFKKKENHILIGTEMIAKGHDFLDVTVVGIISIDQMLNLPFYNTNERVFQLITQCIGRAGRSDKPGIAYIQSYTQNSYAIEIGCSQDYELFYQKELQNRKIAANPPYFHILNVNCVASDIDFLRNKTYEIHSYFVEKLGKNIENSFVRPFVSKKNGKYQMSFVIKYKNQTKILEFCKEFVKVAHKISKLSIHFDIDPLNY